MVGWPTSSMNSLIISSKEDCLGRYMMDGKKIGCRTTDNQDGAVRQLGGHNFL
jgi:hypothetical protein